MDDNDEKLSEVLQATAAAKAARERAEAARAKRWPIVMGVGIGSAALAAAMIYGRPRKTDRKG